MILIILFIATVGIIFYNPKKGIFAIFVYWVFFSNAYQTNLFIFTRQIDTIYSFIPMAQINFIDQQSLRFLILCLFFSVIFLKRSGRLEFVWLLNIIIAIVIISSISILYNGMTIRDGFSSVSILIINLLFLFSVLNVKFDRKEISIFLLVSFVFLLVNSLVQLHQFLFFAYGDVDLTMGLLNGNVQTPTLAYIISFYYLINLKFTKPNIYIVGSIYLIIIQLISSYLKGLIGIAFIILLAFRKMIFKGYRLSLTYIILISILVGISSFIFTDTVKDYEVFYDLFDFSNIPKLGPLVVWTQFMEFWPNQPESMILGYGPSSYGSLNTSDDKGFGNSKLGKYLDLSSSTTVGGRSFFSTALSTLGNILWEFGIIVLILYLYVYIYIFKESSRILRENNPELRAYAEGVKYIIVFILFLYFFGFGGTNDEFFTWAHTFVIFSYIYGKSKS